MSDERTAPLLKRAFMFLEDQEWQRAEEYCEKVLDIEPENAEAYLGLLLVTLKISDECELKNATVTFEDQKFYQKALRFADSELKLKLENYNVENIYCNARRHLDKATGCKDCFAARDLLKKISDKKDVEQDLVECDEKASDFQKKADIALAMQYMNSSNDYDLYEAIGLFQKYDSEEFADKIDKCKKSIDLIKKENEEKERREEKKRKTILISIAVTFALVFLSIITVCSSITYSNNKKAEEIYNNFLGLSFSGTDEDDNGFYSGYSRGDLDSYKVYYLEKTKERLVFNEDGTVYYESSISNTVLAYPKFYSIAPSGYNDSYDGTYDSFEVLVSFDGTVYVKFGSNKCRISVDSNNVPQAIYDYFDVDLH